MFVFFDKVLWLAGVALTALLVLACIAAFVSLPLFPLVDSFSILVPWLIAANLIFMVFWAWRGKKVVAAPLLALLLAGLCFGMPVGFGPDEANRQTGLTVLSYNVRGFNARKLFEPRDAGEKIVSLVKGQDPDIICFQEFNGTFAKDFEYFPESFITPQGTGKAMQAIYSKYPIINKGTIPFPKTNNNALFVDILYGKDTLRVYNVHLQSYQISSRQFLQRNYGLDFLMRLNAVSGKHREQARLVRDHMLTSPYQTIVCGDFNATAFSRPYQIISRGYRDSFREKGRGWGETYYLNQILPYRIDFILTSSGLEVLDHRNFDEYLSDHLPVKATLLPQGK